MSANEGVTLRKCPKFHCHPTRASWLPPSSYKKKLLLSTRGADFYYINRNHIKAYQRPYGSLYARATLNAPKR